MKLAISNLAWDSVHDPAVAALLESHEIKGVEIAPTKKWNEPLDASDSQIADYREFWNGFGIEIVSLQSLLFSQPDLELFSSARDRDEMCDYLKSIIDLAAKLGARTMVFGSPRNRQKGELSADEAMNIAVPFFHAIGHHAESCGMTFCIEPNPAEYGCDWITNSEEGVALVHAVRSPGFRLHLDAAGITLAGENPARAITSSASFLKSFHISEPRLGVIGSLGDKGSDHHALADALRGIDYDGWVSIEMIPERYSLDAIEGALGEATRFYG